MSKKEKEAVKVYLKAIESKWSILGNTLVRSMRHKLLFSHLYHNSLLSKTNRGEHILWLVTRGHFPEPICPRNEINILRHLVCVKAHVHACVRRPKDIRCLMNS